MAHAEKCPVCKGNGCQGCGGRGWVEVSDDAYQADILGKYHKIGEHNGKVRNKRTNEGGAREA